MLIVMPSFNPYGGGEALAVRAVAALRGVYRLSTLSLDPPDLERINCHLDLDLAPEDFTPLVPSGWLLALLRRIPARLTHLRYSLLLRACQGIAGEFDQILGFYNEGNFGPPAIQYIHNPTAASSGTSPAPRPYAKLGHLSALYHWLGDRLSRLDAASIHRNLTLVNSIYTRDLVQSAHGIEGTVLYPPVSVPCTSAPWSQKRDGFAWIGRIHPCKKAEVAIQIVQGVRERGFPVGLELFGARDDAAHLRQLQSLIAPRREWCRLHIDLPRKVLFERVGQLRYGLHTMANEAFGMAVCEMMGSGCITFVPGRAGPAEIMQHHPDLCFSDPTDAVAKICRLLNDPARQQATLEYVGRRAEAFSDAVFAAQLREIVAAAIASG